MEVGVQRGVVSCGDGCAGVRGVRVCCVWERTGGISPPPPPECVWRVPPGRYPGDRGLWRLGVPRCPGPHQQAPGFA